MSWDTQDQSKPAEITVLKWLKKPAPNMLQNIEQNPQAKEKWIGLCLPDHKLLAHWIKTYPHFEKTNIHLWQNALQKGSYPSIVYFRPSPVGGAFKPTCETEALLAQGWTTHSKHVAYAKTVQMLLTPDKKPTPPAPKTESPKVKTTQNESQPPENKGCSCQSTH